MKACLKNNRQAQHALYDRYAASMKGVCSRYANSVADSEDILQESFIKVFRNMKQYKDSGQLGGWIHRITVNTAIEYYRKQKSIAKQINDLKLDTDTEVSSELFQTIDLESLLDKIQNLPNGYRVVFNLYAIEGYNHREIAERLGISEGTSKSQFARAKKILQQQLHAEMEYEQNSAKHVK